MTDETARALHEVFDQWGAWMTVVGYVLPVGTDPLEADPKAVRDALGAMQWESMNRLLHLLVGHGNANTMQDAAKLLGEVWALTHAGRRPRSGRESGLLGGDDAV